MFFSLFLLFISVCGNEIFYFRGTIILKDKPDSPLDDPKNIRANWLFSSTLITEPKNLIEEARVQCHKNPDVIKFWVSTSPCEYEVANAALQDLLTNPQFEGKIIRQEVENSISAINLLLSSLHTQPDIFSSIPSLPQLPQHSTSLEKISIAIIVPVTSKGFNLSSPLAEFPLLKYLIPSLAEHFQSDPTPSVVSNVDGKKKFLFFSIYLGYDIGDPIYDNPTILAEILEIISYFLPVTSDSSSSPSSTPSPIKSIFPIAFHGLESKVVHLWNEMTGRAYRDGTEYFTLLGDDTVIQTHQWARKLIEKLERTRIISPNKRLLPWEVVSPTNSFPLPNFGVLSFFDESSSHFPTFPFFHRTHLEIFHPNKAIDPFFTNNFGDPWLSDVYAIFHASYVMRGTIGGVVGGGGGGGGLGGERYQMGKKKQEEKGEENEDDEDEDEEEEEEEEEEEMDSPCLDCEVRLTNKIGGTACSTPSTPSSSSSSSSLTCSSAALSPRYATQHPDLNNYLDLVQRGRRRVAQWLSVHLYTLSHQDHHHNYQLEQSTLDLVVPISHLKSQRMKSSIATTTTTTPTLTPTPTPTTTTTPTSFSPSLSLKTHHHSFPFDWSLDSLSYGEEGIFYELYCTHAPGCTLQYSEEEMDVFEQTLSRWLPFRHSSYHIV